MEYSASRKFSFVSTSLPPDTFGVVNFRGIERLSSPYRFYITLASDDLAIDFKSIMNRPATLTFHREGGADIPHHGIVANFEQLHEVDGLAFYRAHLVPRFWWLSVVQQNQVFLNKTVPEFCGEILKDGGLFQGMDFEFRLQGAYEPVEYVCQYGETHLNFLSRWCEKEGIYYYFEQAEDREKVVFTDTKIAHVDSPSGGPVAYSPPSGLETLHSEEAVRSFRCRQNALPARVLLKDYNYRKPSLEVTGEAEVDPSGTGTVYFYHEHFRTREDGARLAKIRAESILCKGEEYYGEGSAPYLAPGFTFVLTKHYRDAFNRKYLTVEAVHEGDQTGFLLAGAGGDGEERKLHYLNRFTAIPAETQFRPRLKAMKPKVSGTIPAVIDAAESGQYAELDEMGRYKVIIPFDLSGRKDGKASSWIRMAQPYGGSGHGMHFPLHKGTEVLLTFVNGDPDRPIIASSVPNPLTPSLVTSGNKTSNIIHTSGGNKIHMEDQDGSQHLILHSPVANSTIRLGKKASPTEGSGGEQGGMPTPDQVVAWYAGHEEELKGYREALEDYKHEDDSKGPLNVPWQTMENMEEGLGIELATSNWLDISAQLKNEVILGDSNEMVVGGVGDVCLGGRAIVSLVAYTDITVGIKHEWVPFKSLKFVGIKREETIEKKEKTANEDLFAAVSRRVTEVESNLGTRVSNVSALNTERFEWASSEIITQNEVIKRRLATCEEDLQTATQQVINTQRRVLNGEAEFKRLQAQTKSLTTQYKKIKTEVTESDTANRTGEVELADFETMFLS